MTRAVLSLILSAMLAACAGSLFKNKIPPPTMYMLSARKAPVADAQSAAAPQAAPGSSTAADLAVLRPRVRAGLDTDRIAALYPDRRMDYFANVRWSGPLDEVLLDLAVQEIHANPGLHNVSADRSVFASAYWLEIEVTDFQAEYADSGGAPTVTSVPSTRSSRRYLLMSKFAETVLRIRSKLLPSVLNVSRSEVA